MAEWWIYVGNSVVHKPLTRERNVTSAKLTRALSTSGTLEVTVPQTHPLYGDVLSMTILGFDVWRVERDGVEVFRGWLYKRAVHPLDAAVELVVEGDMGRLNSATMPPYDFIGTYSELLALYLDAYNDQCSPAIRPGTVAIEQKYSTGQVVRSNTSATNLWSELLAKTADSSDGGYLMMRHVDGTPMLDWLSTPATPGAQPVKLGWNLTDMDDTVDGSTLYTAVYATGKTVDDVQLDVSSIADGTYGDVRKDGRLVVNVELEALHGVISETVAHSDDEDASTLFEHARADARALSDPRSVNVSAIDMADAGYDVARFDPGQNVPVDTPSLSGTVLVAGVVNDLLDSTGGSITFGEPSGKSSTANATNGIIINDAKVQAATAQVQSKDAQAAASAAAVTAKDAATITITSTHGTTFKSNRIASVLQVSVFQPGGARIETLADLQLAFGSTAHIRWRWRRDDDEWKTILSTDSRLSNDGFWMTITPDDVNERTSFEATMETD